MNETTIHIPDHGDWETYGQMKKELELYPELSLFEVAQNVYGLHHEADTDDVAELFATIYKQVAEFENIVKAKFGPDAELATVRQDPDDSFPEHMVILVSGGKK